MALGDDYVTLQALKTRVGLSAGDTAEDTLLQSVIKAATEGINHFTGRDFQKVTAAAPRTYRPLSPHLVVTEDFHTTADLLVEVDDGDTGTYGTTLAASDYELEPANGVVSGQTGWPYWKIRLVSGSVFPTGLRRTVRVTARWGWAEVPDSVGEAAAILAEDLYKIKDSPLGVGGFGEMGRLRARENPHVANLINDYRRIGRRLRVA
jgi:hypothetical protein